MADYLTFANLVSEIKRAAKTTKGSKDDLIKAMINMVYLDEIICCDDMYPMFWMIDFDSTLKSVTPSELSAITRAADGIFTTSAARGLSIGHIIALFNIAGMTELNDLLYVIGAVPTPTTFKIGVNTTTYTVYTSGGNVLNKGITLSESKSVERVLTASWNYEAHMDEITRKEIEEDTRYHEHDQTSRPTRWYHGKSFSGAGAELNQLLWYPCANAVYRLRYWFEKRAPKLVNNADVPLLPHKYHSSIIAGVLTRLTEYSNVQVENAVIWPAIYKSQLNLIRSFNRSYWSENPQVFRKGPYLL